MPFPKGKSRGSGFHRTLFGEGARAGRDARAWAFIATGAGIFRRAGFFHGVRAMTAPLLGLPLEELAFEMESIGEKPYLGLFSLASAVSIVWLAMSYNAASTSP